MAAAVLLLLIWLALGVLMATADAWATNVNFRVGTWLFLFFAGVLLTFWWLLPAEPAMAATGALVGVYLGPYNLTWQLWMRRKGVPDPFPVPLWPFPVKVSEAQWYSMMVLGFALTAAGLAVLA